MHQRIFHYAMLIYAFGFIAALTLNIDIPEQTARAPASTADPAASKTASNAVADCAALPGVLAVASAGLSPGVKAVDVKTPCVAPAREVAPAAIAPKPAAIPVVEPLMRQEL